jgi:hypothetical protein
MAKREPRTVTLTEISETFHVVAMGDHPPIGRRSDGNGWYVRVLVTSRRRGGYVTDRYEYFYIDDQGLITEAPRGYAKDYRPGRVPVDQLEAAVERYGGGSGA